MFRINLVEGGLHYGLRNYETNGCDDMITLDDGCKTKTAEIPADIHRIVRFESRWILPADQSGFVSLQSSDLLN